MELVTLNDDLQPEKTITNFSSLVWTERYSKSGDFQLTTNDVSTAISLLPLESLVSLRNSNVPMVVEVYKIEKPRDAEPVLTITGRSFETVLERRASVRDPMGTSRSPWVSKASKPSDAAYLAMRTVLGDFAAYYTPPTVGATIPATIPTPVGGAAAGSPTEVLPLVAPAVSVNDAIPEISLVTPADFQIPEWDTTIVYSIGDIVGYGTAIYQALVSDDGNTPTSGGDANWAELYTGISFGWGSAEQYEIPPKNLYTAVAELLAQNHHGIKAVRPAPGENTIGIEIYNGADLTEEVVFSAKFDRFDKSTYLLSASGSANVGYVYSSSSSQQVLKTTAPEPAGLARRVILTELTEVADDTAEVRTSRGLADLYQNNATALYDGEVAEQIAAGYNIDYFLGDIIRLDGEYGLGSNVRVAEFIRTSDSSGTKAYPAFEAIDE